MQRNCIILLLIKANSPNSPSLKYQSISLIWTVELTDLKFLNVLVHHLLLIQNQKIKLIKLKKLLLWTNKYFSYNMLYFKKKTLWK